MSSVALLKFVTLVDFESKSWLTAKFLSPESKLYLVQFFMLNTCLKAHLDEGAKLTFAHLEEAHRF